jgi:succinylglutamate desuccinylase
MVNFDETHRLPDGVLDATAQGLHELLPRPTLVHFPGLNPQPLFVSVLLHGNEDAGLKAVQQVLRRATGNIFPRALSVFFGNVEAARHNVRFLPSQPDFNRIWDAGTQGDPYRAMAQSVLLSMKSRRVFAALDLHNNTGRNPLYSCITPSNPGSRKLAALFSDIAVHADAIAGTLSAAFAPHCPALTCECGEIGNTEGVQRAASLVERCLSMTEAQLAQVDDSALRTYEAFATVKVPDALSISVAQGDLGADIQLSPEIDLLNFHELPAGYSFAKVRRNLTEEALLAFDERGARMPDVFVRHQDEVRLACASTPAMLTPHEDAIRKTCLGYLMRRVQPPSEPARLPPGPSTS